MNTENIEIISIPEGSTLGGGDGEELVTRRYEGQVDAVHEITDDYTSVESPHVKPLHAPTPPCSPPSNAVIAPSVSASSNTVPAVSAPLEELVIANQRIDELESCLQTSKIFRDDNIMAYQTEISNLKSKVRLLEDEVELEKRQVGRLSGYLTNQQGRSTEAATELRKKHAELIAVREELAEIQANQKEKIMDACQEISKRCSSELVQKTEEIIFLRKEVGSMREKLTSANQELEATEKELLSMRCARDSCVAAIQTEKQDAAEREDALHKEIRAQTKEMDELPVIHHMTKSEMAAFRTEIFDELKEKFLGQISTLNTKVADLYGELTLARSSAMPAPPKAGNISKEGYRSMPGAHERKVIAQLTAQIRHHEIDMELLNKKSTEEQAKIASLMHQLKAKTSENSDMKVQMQEMGTKLRHFKIDAGQNISRSPSPPKRNSTPRRNMTSMSHRTGSPQRTRGVFTSSSKSPQRTRGVLRLPGVPTAQSPRVSPPKRPIAPGA